MLQRKQSIFMSLTAILMIIALFVPIGIVTYDQQLFIMDHMPLMLITLTVIGLQGYNLSLYKSRKKQLKLNYYAILALALLAGTAHYYAHDTPLIFDYQMILKKATWGSSIPVLGIISQILAIRGIKQDEALIKSMNRFR